MNQPSMKREEAQGANYENTAYQPPLHKRLIDKPWVRALVTLPLSLLVRLLWRMSRHTWQVAPEAAPYIAGEKQCIYCFWHGRLLFMMYFAHPKRRAMNVLISQHRDGVLLAETVGWFNIRTIHGSSSKGSLDALRGILARVKAGDNIAITPDGPRGPYQTAAHGTVWIAKMTGLPIIPMGFSATKKRHLRSWDKFLLPLPFGRVVMRADAPFFVARDADDAALEDARSHLEILMRQQIAALDAECA